MQYWEIALAQLNRQQRSASQINRLSGIYGDIGNVYLKQNKQKEAFESFQAACDLAPSAECHKRVGLTLFNSQQWEGAAREFAKVIETQKEDADLYGMLGTALAQKGDIQNAISIFREGLRYAKTTPMQSRLHRNIGNMFISAKQYTMAEPEFRLALTKDWGDADNHFGLAVSLLGLNQPSGAVDSLKSVLRIDPKNERARSMINSIETSLQQSSPNG